MILNQAIRNAMVNDLVERNVTDLAAVRVAGTVALGPPLFESRGTSNGGQS